MEIENFENSVFLEGFGLSGAAARTGDLDEKIKISKAINRKYKEWLKKLIKKHVEKQEIIVEYKCVKSRYL